MQLIQKLLRGFNRFQERHHWLGFPLAVFVKFGEDQASNAAALIAYYGFLSLFPLLLVSFTLIPIIVRHNMVLQERVIHGILNYFPIIGPELQQNIHAYHRSGLGLVVGLVVTVYGARGIANSLQDAANMVWQVPKYKRPGFPFNTLRSLGIIVVGGVGLVTTTIGTGLITGFWHGGIWAKGVAMLVALGVNWLVFSIVFRLATAPSIATRNLLTGAGLAAVSWQLLQIGGGFLLIHELKNTSPVYGIFAVVLGLLFWLYLQAELYVYAMEVNVVKFEKLWPRSIAQPPFTAADKKVYGRYIAAEQRKRESAISIDFKPEKH